MNSVLWAGAAVGAVFGLLHAIYIYRLVAIDGHVRAAYYALWTFGLWLLFGPYVLVLWVISVIPYVIAKPFRWRM